MNTRELRTDSAMFVLLTGEPGTGKSIAAHSWPEDSYTFDHDNKMKAVANYYPDRNFEYDHFNDVFDVRTKLAELKRSCPYQSLIWDGWSTFSHLALKSMLDVRSPNAKKIMKGNIEKYQIEDYGGESRAIELVLDDLQYINRVHNVHVITICHIIRVVTHDIIRKVDTEFKGLYIPGGKIAFAVPIPFDEVWYLSKETSFENGNLEYVITTSGSSDVTITKTALKLPQKFTWNGSKSLYETILLKHSSAL